MPDISDQEVTEEITNRVRKIVREELGKSDSLPIESRQRREVVSPIPFKFEIGSRVALMKISRFNGQQIYKGIVNNGTVEILSSSVLNGELWHQVRWDYMNHSEGHAFGYPEQDLILLRYE